MVSLPSIPTLIIIGLGILFTVLFVKRASETNIGQATGEIGAGIGSLGTGASALGQGIGTGLAGLLNPFFTIADIIAKFQALVASNTSSKTSTPSGQAGGFSPVQSLTESAPTATRGKLLSDVGSISSNLWSTPLYTALGGAPLQRVGLNQQGMVYRAL